MKEAPKPSVQWLDIDADQAGQRIDNFLLNYLKGVPKSRIYRILRKGEVRVNRGRIRPGYRLQSGDQLRLPPIRVSETKEPGVPGQAQQDLQNRILYEDERLLVLDKPSGMAVHGGSGLRFGVIEALRALRPDAYYLELVHRLDRETSGCLMIAKKRSELRALHGLLRDGGITKRYLLLAQGDCSAEPRRIDEPLLKNQLRSGERVVRVHPEGKPAVTHFRLLENLSQASYLEADLETGRTHQIRVHAAYSGHPLAGDERYGDKTFNGIMRDLGLNRLFLHAHYLSFRIPDSDRSIEVSAPLAADLRLVLDKLT
jgi:23S rRNA pseudouridine955/2504/2580 synthase